MGIISKLQSGSSLKDAAILAESKFFNDKDVIPTMIPALNVALSGELDGGITPGLCMIAGDSKNFKTGLALTMMKAYLDKYANGAILFYDSEFGSPQSYFKSFGIDITRVLHTPIRNIEELKFDVINQLENLKRGDRVMIVIDSIGNLASLKELEDAKSKKSVADMTRAKQLKSLFRMVTPYLAINDIPMVAINHSYSSMDLFPKEIVSGGRGSYFSSNTILMMSRRQVKDSTGITGFQFVMTIEKSRGAKEKSKIILDVSYDDGISKWSGLMDMAIAAKVVNKSASGFYQKVDQDTGELIGSSIRLKDTFTSEFWTPILGSTFFKEFVKNKYSISTGDMIADESFPVLEPTDDVEVDVEPIKPKRKYNKAA